MSMIVGQIETELGLDDSDFVQGVSRAGERWENLAEELDIGRELGKAERDLAGVAKAAEGAGQDVAQEFDKMGQAADRAGKQTKNFGDIAKFAIGGLISGGVLALVDSLTAGFMALGDAVVAMGREMVGVNSQFEQYEIQFSTLLGSTEAAQERMEELAEFGRTTPFELPGVVEASRVLEVFGGEVLATGDNLRLVGDIAAGTGKPFEDVAFWVGRLYDALQNGQPFGEAAMELQQMGAMSGATRKQLEDMQDAGASANDIFATFSDQTGEKFSGMMQEMSSSMAGMVSNLEDTKQAFLQTLGQETFGVLTDILKSLMGAIEENQELIERWAQEAGHDIGRVVEALAGFDGLDTAIYEAAESLLVLLDALADIVEFLERHQKLLELGLSIITADYGGLIMDSPVTDDGLSDMEEAAEAADRLEQRLSETRQTYEGLSERLYNSGAINGLSQRAAEAEGAVSGFSVALEAIPAKGIMDEGGWVDRLIPQESIRTMTDRAEQVVGAFESYTTDVQRLESKALEDQQEYTRELRDLAQERVDIQEETRQDVAAAYAELADDLEELGQDYLATERQFAIDYQETLAEGAREAERIEWEAADTRLSIAKDAAESRIALEQDTQEAIAAFALEAEERAFRTRQERENLDFSHGQTMGELQQQIDSILGGIPQSRIDQLPEGESVERLLDPQARARLAQLRKRQQQEQSAYEHKRKQLEEEAEFEARIEEEKHKQALEELQARFRAEEQEREEQTRKIAQQAERELRDLAQTQQRALSQLESHLQEEYRAYIQHRERLERDTEGEVRRLREQEQQKLQVVSQRLEEERIRHQAAQSAIQQQIYDTQQVYTSNVDAIIHSNDRWAESLQSIFDRAWQAKWMLDQLTTPTWDVDMQVDDYFRGRSPSPFEENLAGMLSLLNRLDTINVQPGLHAAQTGYGVGGGATLQLNAPLIGQAVVRSDEDVQAIAETIVSALQESLDMSLGQSHRFPAGVTGRY